MKKSCALMLWVAALMLAFAGAAVAMDAEELIAKHIEATGGQEKIAAIQSLKLTGKFMTQGMEFPFTMIQKRPHFLRIEVNAMGMDIVQAYDGETGWSINPMTGSSDPQPLGDLETKGLKLQADMDGALVDYAKKGFTVEYLGEEDVEGTPCYKLRLDTKQDIVVDYFIDKEYFLAIKQASVVTLDENKIESQTYMSDFQDVNGVVMAFSMETRMGDMVANQIKFENAEQNVVVDDAVFTMPEAPGAPSTPQAGGN